MNSFNPHFIECIFCINDKCTFCILYGNNLYLREVLYDIIRQKSSKTCSHVPEQRITMMFCINIAIMTGVSCPKDILDMVHIGCL